MSRLQPLRRRSQTVWPGLSVEHLLTELDQIKQFVLLYPAQGEKGPHRTATVLSKQTLAQRSLADTLGLDKLTSAAHG
ncbi:MAG TPA: hypothetical protein VGK29_24165 [Paludibaculum sp.]